MSRNVDIVRRIYAEGLLDRELGQLLELSGPAVEFVNPADAVEPGVRRGPDAIRAAAEGGRVSFAWSEHELHRLFDGGERIVAAVTFRARGKGSGVDVSHEEAHTWTFREGMIVRFEWGRDLDAALAAAGLDAETAVSSEP
jgi:ketosteroid isomerase-like protein